MFLEPGRWLGRDGILGWGLRSTAAILRVGVPERGGRLMRRHPSAYSAVARKNASSQASQKRTWARWPFSTKKPDTALGQPSPMQLGQEPPDGKVIHLRRTGNPSVGLPLLQIPDRKYRIGSWKLATPARVNHRELATAGTAPPGSGPPRTPRLRGTLPPAERARQTESSRP